MILSGSQRLRAYEMMRLIRGFEESIRDLHARGELPGFMHVSVGEEAVPAGVSLSLESDDLILCPHRNHGQVIAKGVPVEAMFAEVYGHVGGTCRAKGGSLHIADVSAGVLGANGIVGAGLPIAVGVALGLKKLGREQVVVAYAGDGAIAGGPSHESLNMASLWKLPILFVREDNQYAESTPRRDYQGIPDVVTYVASYGIPAEAVDGNDLEQVALAASQAIERARAGGGPGFLQCSTYRWYGHNIGDVGAYRPAAEVESWKARDPIAMLRRRILDEQDASEAGLAEIDSRVVAELERARSWAAEQPEPPGEWALEDVYSAPELQWLVGTDR